VSTATQVLIDASRAYASVAQKIQAVLSDHAQLMKLRVTAMVVASAWCGYFVAARQIGIPVISWHAWYAMAALGLVSAGAAALNQVIEREADSLMWRTRTRPVAAGRLGAAHAAGFGLALVIGGAVALVLITNFLTGLLALATAAAYLLMYTPLKSVSPLCTFIGAFPGAMPPLLGWTALRGRVELEALALFAILFFWQFPHFFSIAWLYAEDYERAGIRMLPVVKKDGRATVRKIILYSLLLIPISMLPGFIGMSETAYVVGALILSVGYLWFGLRLREPGLSPAVPESKRLARRLLQASVVYLPLLLALLMLSVEFHV
jgi:protoheme IX farnesyltransferase